MTFAPDGADDGTWTHNENSRLVPDGEVALVEGYIISAVPYFSCIMALPMSEDSTCRFVYVLNTKSNYTQSSDSMHLHQKSAI